MNDDVSLRFQSKFGAGQSQRESEASKVCLTTSPLSLHPLNGTKLEDKPCKIRVDILWKL